MLGKSEYNIASEIYKYICQKIYFFWCNSEQKKNTGCSVMYLKGSSQLKDHNKKREMLDVC